MRIRKSIIAAVLLLSAGQVAFAQSADEGMQDLYYQQYKSAEGVFNQLISKNPKDAANYYHLGQAQLGLELKDSAQASFQKGLQADPESALNLVGEAHVDILNKNYDAAKQKFQKAVDETKGRDMEVGTAILKAAAEPGIPKDLGDLAISLMKQIKDFRKNRNDNYTAEQLVAMGNVNYYLPNGGGEAANRYEDAKSADPKYAASYYYLGNLYDAATIDSLAVKNWTTALSVDAKYAPADYALYHYYRIRNLDSARTFVEKYMALSDDKLNAQVNLVDVLWLQGDFQQAIDKADSLKNNPDVSEPTQTRLYKLIAVSQNSLGDSLDAKKNFDTYFERQDTSKVLPFDYIQYGEILGKLNQQDSSLYYLSKGVAKDTSTNIRALRNSAEELKKQSNYLGAALYYKKIITQDSAKAEVNDYFWYAFSKFYADDYQGAEQAFKTMTSKYPDQPSGFYWLGVSQMAQDSTYKGLAIDAYNKFLELKSGADTAKTGGPATTSQKQKIFSYMAAYYAQGNQYDKAAEYADKLTQLDPQSPLASNIYYNMAYAAYKEKNLDKAEQFSQKALDINPNNDAAKQIVDYVNKMKEYNKKMQDYEKKKKASQGNG